MLQRIILILMLVFIPNAQGCASAAVKQSPSAMRISEKKVKIGMTEQQVLEILGKPRDINTWKEDKLLYEGEIAWHYDRFLFGPYRVVYFKSGLVTQVEEFHK